MNLLEAIQKQLNSAGIEQSVDRANAILREIERLPAEHFPAWLPELLAFVCLHDEAMLRWSLNGTPMVHSRIANDALETRDFA